MKAAALVVFTALFAALPSSLLAVSGTPVYDSTLTPNGYQQITVLTSSTALTVPGNTKITLIQAESQPVRWRDDGTPPTAAIGSLIDVGETLVYNGDPTAIRFIETAASAKLNVVYYR